MKYEAFIFDLFGTLVKIYSRQKYDNAVLKMAEALCVSPDEFSLFWLDSSYSRSVGKIPSVEKAVIHVCKQIGFTPSLNQIQAACKIRNDFVIKQMAPRETALSVLSQLKNDGYKLGLISNCSTEVPALWEKTTFAGIFDVTIFSSTSGLKKPDPKIYILALNELGIEAHKTLYIADGDSGELAGAQKMGITPVKLSVQDEIGGDSLREDKEEWHGPTISSLSEVLDLVK